MKPGFLTIIALASLSFDPEVQLPPLDEGAILEAYKAEIWQEEDTVFTELLIVARSADFSGLNDIRRYVHAFDLQQQSVELVSARISRDGGREWLDVPEWAIDTLGSTNSWTRQFVVAYPGILPNSLVEIHVIRKDWSLLSHSGLWFVYSPASELPARSLEISVRMESGNTGIDFIAEGYHVINEDGRIVFIADFPETQLILTCIDSWSSLVQLLLNEANTHLSVHEYPPDLREAALEISARSAGEHDLVEQTRFAITDNFRPMSISSECRRFCCRTLQEILDTRIASPLEMALLTSAILRFYGFDAEPVIATDNEPFLPVPDSWDRFLVEVKNTTGCQWLLEPSAFLVPAGYVYRPEGLWLLGFNDSRLRYISPNPSHENYLEEKWTINPKTGSVTLEISSGGFFSMKLRRRFAGLSRAGKQVAFARWLWQSGTALLIENIDASDFYDICTPAVITLEAGMACTDSDSVFLLLPGLIWETPENLLMDFSREWIIEGADWIISPQDVEIIESEGSFFLSTHLPDSYLFLIVAGGN